MDVRVVNDHLVFPYPAPEALVLFDSPRMAEREGVNWVAVPHTLEHARVLNNLGAKVTSPIRREYKWPGQFTPFKHQIATAEFLTLHSRAFVLNGMGTAKTLAALWAADYLMQKGQVERAVVVAPLSTLQRVWGDTVFINLPHRSFVVLHGSRIKRLSLLEEKHDFYIVNPEGLMTVGEIIKHRKDINLIIVDEIAEYRNANTKKWRTLNSILSPTDRVWGLTGAPTPQAPTDAYAQVKLIKPENLNGLSFTRFKLLTMHQLTTFKWMPCNNAMERVYQIMKPAIRFTKEDCIDLPPTLWEDREVMLSPPQKKHYDFLVKHSLTNIDGTQVQAVNAAVLLQKLVQAACGEVYGTDGTVAHLDAGPRLSLVEELVEGSDGKVLVFVPFKHALKLVAEHLRPRWTVEIINGDISATYRNRVFQNFQGGADPHVIVAHPKTMAHGLTLTAATTIVWYAPFASHAIYEQACQRVARPGQTRNTSIIHIAGTPVERRIYAALREKKRMQDVLLEMVKADGY